MSKVRYYPKVKNPLVPIPDPTSGVSPSNEQAPFTVPGSSSGAGEYTFSIPGSTPQASSSAATPGGAAAPQVHFKSSRSGASSSRRSKRRRPPKTCVSAPAAIFVFLFGGIVFLLGVIFTSCWIAQGFPPIEYGAVFVVLGFAVFIVGCVFFCWAKRAQTLHYAPTLRAKKNAGSGKGDSGKRAGEPAGESGGGAGGGEMGDGDDDDVEAAFPPGQKSRVGFDSTPQSPESKDAEDAALLATDDGKIALTTTAPTPATRTTKATSAAGGVGNNSFLNGVIHEDTEDESGPETALLSATDELELKSCSLKVETFQLGDELASITMLNASQLTAADGTLSQTDTPSPYETERDTSDANTPRHLVHPPQQRHRHHVGPSIGASTSRQPDLHLLGETRGNI